MRRAESGESTESPGAFFTGENSSSRVISSVCVCAHTEVETRARVSILIESTQCQHNSSHAHTYTVHMQCHHMRDRTAGTHGH